MVEAESPLLPTPSSQPPIPYPLSPLPISSLTS